MAVEIERRFLVDPKILEKYDDCLRRIGNEYCGTVIRQGYLSNGGGATVRVRDWIHMWADRPRGWELTVKGPGSLRRAEISIPIDRHQADELLELCETRVKKFRYEYTIGGRKWEIDEFRGSLEGLWLAEVEFEATENVGSIEIPAFCVSEVTEDKDYSNASLAKFARQLEKAQQTWLSRDEATARSVQKRSP